MVNNEKKNNIYTCVYIITDEYINNIKNIINDTKNKKDLKKYTKWYIFFKYIKIIFKLYCQNHINIDYFIKKTDLLCGNSKIITTYDTLLFYNLYIPHKNILSNIQNNLDDIHANFINDVIYNDSTAKKLYKMIQNIYFIVHNNNNICWQFKNDNAIMKLTNISSNNLCIIYDNTNIYIKHKITETSNYSCHNNELPIETNNYPINDDSNDSNICDIDSFCSDNDIYDDESIYNTYNTTKIQLCNYEQENINKISTRYDYIYDMIKNISVIYLYIIIIIIKFYTNINILKYDSCRRLLYIILCNR